MRDPSGESHDGEGDDMQVCHVDVGPQRDIYCNVLMSVTSSVIS